MKKSKLTKKSKFPILDVKTNKLGMKYNSPEVLATIFFKLRFNKNPSQDSLYFDTWVDRFRTLRPEIYMDKESLEIYNKMKKKYRI